jgi:hypothetical protein
MILATAGSGQSALVMDHARVPTLAVYPGLVEADFQLFSDVFDAARRLIEVGDSEEDLDRAAVLLSWCESGYRVGPKAVAGGALGLRLQDASYGADFAARVPKDLLTDLAAMRASGRVQLEQWGAAIRAGDQYLPNPRLSGHRVVSAVPDWLVGDTVIECKAIEPVTSSKLRDALLQLLGYALLDFDDAHHIREVAVWLPRRGALRAWSLNQLLGSDAGSRDATPSLRVPTDIRRRTARMGCR